MKFRLQIVALLAVSVLAVAAYSFAQYTPLPVRGLHVMAPKPDELQDSVRFIREALPKEGVNVLVLEFNYRYKSLKRPEVVDEDALSREDVRSLVSACRFAGVRLIPEINLLGHQSWSKTTGALLRSHPEFDETPGKYPENQGIYCRSYCPLHPGVHDVVFDLVDDLADACEADAFHVGMDEVFLLGENDCPRCKGKNKADLFAQEVRTLHDHLAKTGRTMWMWGDRFLDGDITGLGQWEASKIGTAAALQQIPKDIVICDWHYESAAPTAAYFAVAGFPVVSCPWRKPGVALAELQLVQHVRLNAPPATASRMLGMLQTTWSGGLGSFAKAYFSASDSRGSVDPALLTFRELFAEMRKGTAK